ncbi:DUF3152 domain-containing protein [Streptomyces sp. A012304]|uniref:DUF3152 domain-containing protein n=1 Tax=Streptomyces sp. A012304 TaxID=375446 RepID=UPI002231919B|nr:DUF3152 domain-containing protein [Streptomyces sp. A012304]GKQ35511.1 membrane protein [Streptomyces sp. A012304]
MTAHKREPSRRRRKPSARGRRLAGALAASAVLGAVGGAVAMWTQDDAGRAPTAPPEARAGASVAAGRSGADGPPPATGLAAPAGSPARGTTEPPRSEPSPSGTPLPHRGPGTFVTAPGESAKAGKGTALRYRVEVEDGITLSAADTAAEVERVLADPRGWTADGHSAFRRVSTGPADFVVRLATPATVDRICAEGGLDTGGRVNCSVNRDVMVNLRRWVLATPVYAKDVTAYRALIINHEVGHFLGHGHVTCPGPGKPAPAMMQQIKGMSGCVPNVWPYDSDGRPITGPAVP